MPRKVSLIEKRVRQTLVQNIGGPLFLRAASKVVFAAETRMRRSLPIERYCSGVGLEIGAAASPAIVPLGSEIRYADKYPLEVIAGDPELAGLTPVSPDHICSAERLEGIPDDSQDFLLAFSLLEHVQDPIGALSSFVRVTRRGGTVIITVPDKRSYGPDMRRPITTFEHMIRDFEEGPEWSLEAHLRESAALGKGMSPSEVERFVSDTRQSDGHTHFHVWTPESFLSFIQRTREHAGLSFEILEFAQYGHEALAVLQVTS